MRFVLLVLLIAACGDDSAPESSEAATDESPSAGSAEPSRLDREFPRHAAITGTQLRVHAEPREDGTVVGWLRVGSQVRVSAETAPGSGCQGGWLSVYPTGFVCGAEGIEVRDEAITVEVPTDEGWKNDQPTLAAARGALVLPPGARDRPLPYDYYYVKESTVPEYHRLPSRNEQRAALAKAGRYRELYQINEDRAARYLRGEAEDGPRGTAVTARYLERGFYVASNGSEVRASRRFVRTTQGSYIKQAQLEERNGHDFEGVELTEEQTLPVAWTTRTSRPRILEEGEEVRWSDEEDVEPWPRQTFLTGWQERRNIGGDVMHVIETERGMRYLRAWYAAVAERIDRPEEVAEGEPWVHVDLSEQTLVLYEGDTPVFATLVSTGVEDNETPTGVFEIRRKHVTDTMANIGDNADDRYRIEDVPWTQYFEGSFALHTAFWHTRFGLPRSHGCVNMTPHDAHRVFQSTWPALPEGWHGLSTDGTEFQGSHVVVTR
ncbi:MAG: L,D-transpeptidase [Myxococcota bacterium]